ncbi:MAG: energy transducer TonB [Candidatus Binatia bacterium]
MRNVATGGTTGRRTAAAALASALVHGTVLGICAITAFRIAVDPDRVMIPVSVREPAPPAPPADGAAHALTTAPRPIPAPPPMPVPRRPRLEPTPEALAPTRPAPTARVLPPAPREEPGPEPAAAVAAGGRGQSTAPDDGRAGSGVDRAFRLDQVAVPPAILKAVQPAYPAAARQRGQEGIVIVQAIIDRAGAIEYDSCA